MLRLLRRLPRPVKALLLRAADALGDRPQKIRAGPARGLTLVAPLTRWWQYAGGRHEPHVAETLWRHLGPGGVACDAGAHLGYHTLVMARRVGGSGRVFSFEPVPRHAEALRRTAARNRLPQITVVERALGAACGATWLEEGPTDAMARVLPSPALAIGRLRRIAGTTLDAWAAEEGGLERLDLIKLDVEGGELDALEGGAGMLRRHRPTIVCEAHWSQRSDTDPRRLVDWLEGAGYEVTLLRRPDRPGVTLEQLLASLAGAAPPPHVAAFHVLATAVRNGP